MPTRPLTQRQDARLIENRIAVTNSAALSQAIRQMAFSRANCTMSKISETKETESETNGEGLKQEDEAPRTTAETIRYYLKGYQSLSKAKLGGLVLTTTMAGYGIAPGTFDASDFLIATVGTWFTICSANSINQIMEVKNDSLMNRTKARWLPTQKMSLAHAKTFAAVTGLAGVGSLLLINPLTSALALFNLGLYTAVYTPLKQKHAVNTWVGAVVGAIPPMIGWAAATGNMDFGSWVVGGLLALWQMPHFMALSYSLKDDYHRGGFRMLINTHPEKVAGVVLRYSLAMLPLGALAALSGMTTPWFALDSLLPTGYLTWLSIRFYRNQDKQIARSIFKFSLVMLPAMMLLLLFHKNREPTATSGSFVELKRNSFALIERSQLFLSGQTENQSREK